MGRGVDESDTGESHPWVSTNENDARLGEMVKVVRWEGPDARLCEDLLGRILDLSETTELLRVPPWPAPKRSHRHYPDRPRSLLV